jgi:FKBP-type peptidyl-prolyl cis-trans isomerase
MNKSIIYILFLSVIGFLSGCTPSVEPVDAYAEYEKLALQYGKDNNLTLVKAESGVYYVKTKENALGRIPKAGETLKANYIRKTLAGVFKDSSDRSVNAPKAFVFANYNSEYVYTAFLLKEGESGIFILPDNENGGQTNYVYNVNLISTRNETEQIEEYIKKEFVNTTLKKTTSGLQYIITKPSASGDSAKLGKSVTVAYTGKFLYKYLSRDSNGFPVYTDIFDKGTAYTFAQGANVAGFNEAINSMKVGDKGTFIFPSSLGYGQTARGALPPFSPLLFEIEVTAITK